MNLPELLKIAEAATAGPWEISRMSATAVQGSKGFVVAACGGYSDNRANPDELSKELHGNAAHIAAFNPSVAIELIKRLQEAEKKATWWDEYLPWMRNLNKKPFNLAKLIDQIDAAMN